MNVHESVSALGEVIQIVLSFFVLLCNLLGYQNRIGYVVTRFVFTSGSSVTQSFNEIYYAKPNNILSPLCRVCE
jgi:hypothetical protein